MTRSSEPIQRAFLELFEAQATYDSENTAALRSRSPLGSLHLVSTAPLLLGVSSASLLPLLRLACLGSSKEVRIAAGQLATSKLREALGSYTRPLGGIPQHPESSIPPPVALDEALLWMWMLPSGHLHEPRDNSSSDVTTKASNPPSASCCEAVTSFLTQVVVQLTRRPHEVYELVLDLMAKGGVDESGGEKMVSLLAAAALRSCLKALSSSKMLATDKTAICTYVAGRCCWLL